LAAAVRITRWFDLGLALHLAVGIFDLSNISFTDLGPGTCPTTESAKCDSATRIETTGFTATAAIGAMFHPISFIDVGFNLRGPVEIKSSGTVTATPPPAAPIPLNPEHAEFEAHLPWILRVGARYKFLGADKFEHGDIELDGTYEAWGAAQGQGDQVKIPNLGPFTDINPTITHHYHDTFSVRVGGAYNLRFPVGVLALRLGLFYDSSATDDKDTRMDFDTMAKIGTTVGMGYSVRGVTLNIAYAYLWEPDRNVTNGDIQSINGVSGGNTVSFGTGMTPVVNNGFYHASNQVLSIGLQIAWDELLKKRKTVDWE
jgi:long-subunit fatty acid transport protein